MHHYVNLNGHKVGVYDRESSKYELPEDDKERLLEISGKYYEYVLLQRKVETHGQLTSISQTIRIRVTRSKRP